MGFARRKGAFRHFEGVTQSTVRLARAVSRLDSPRRHWRRTSHHRAPIFLLRFDKNDYMVPLMSKRQGTGVVWRQRRIGVLVVVLAISTGCITVTDSSPEVPSSPEVRMTADRIGLPQGTLDLLILKTLALEPRHGWEISERIRQVSGDVLQVRQGSLYPALHRLERRGWIAASWGTSEHNRRAKYYALTPKGRGQLESDVEAWRALTAAVGHVLDAG